MLISIKDRQKLAANARANRKEAYRRKLDCQGEGFYCAEDVINADLEMLVFKAEALFGSLQHAADMLPNRLNMILSHRLLSEGKSEPIDLIDPVPETKPRRKEQKS